MQNKSYSLKYIAEFVNGQIVGDQQLADNLEITGLGSLQNAGSDQISFLANSKYTSHLLDSSAGAVLISSHCTELLDKCIGVVVDDPYLAFAQVSQLFDWRQPLIPGLNKTAKVGINAQVDDSAQICAGVVIGDDCTIGKRVYIGPNTVIADRCVLGDDTRIEANVTFYSDVELGCRCLVHSGAVLGADGFGFAPSPTGWQKIHQLGGVFLGDDVEVGAGTTIDRGAIESTRIESGVKIDNQVQIAHNVVVGKHSAIAGCTAIAGSTEIGERSTIAGLCGITGHLTLAPQTHVTAMTLVSKSVNASGQAVSSGTGQDSHQNWKKNVVRFKQLNEMSKRLADIERKLERLVKEGR